MAKTNCSFQRFDGKLDTVLRKGLTIEIYERISVTESCIIVTNGGKKAQRTVILGHNAVYFAEVPPKTIKRAIELVQIVSNKIVNDVPTFLSDSERENVLHIEIIYNTCLQSAIPTDDNILVDSLLINDICDQINRIHLYILQGKKGSSNFNHHLNISLEDLLMNSLIKGTNNISITENGISDSKFDMLMANFQSLKSELLLSKDYDKSARLLLELQLGTKKYYLLKKLFWQESILMEYCIQQISENGRIINTFDRIEYCIIVTDVLLIMFTETHPINNRFNILTNESGIVITLSNNLIDMFDVIYNCNNETNQLCKDLAGNVAGIIYELIRLMSQFTLINESLSITMICNNIITRPSIVIVLSHVVDLICDVKYIKSVLVQYRVISFIDRLLHYSQKCVQLFKQHFIEEFRYMTQENCFSNKSLISKLQQVKIKILTK